MGNLNDKEKEFFVGILNENGERILHKIENEVVEIDVVDNKEIALDE